jgi:hypothetical protein
MSRAETPLQIANRELAQAKAHHDELRRLYQIAQVEADRATETQRQLEAQYQSIMVKKKRGIRNGSYNEGSILEIEDAIRNAQDVIYDAHLAHEAMDRAATTLAYKLTEQRKQHGLAYIVPLQAAERDAWAEGVDSRGRPLPLRSDAEHKARIAAASAAKPSSFFGKLGSFFRRGAPAVAPRAPSSARAERQREENARRPASTLSFRGASDPLFNPKEIALRERLSGSEAWAGPPRGGGKPKRRHTKRRKSRKSQKSCK